MFRLDHLGSGITRHVFGIGSYAIKVPRIDRWTRFLRGLLGNTQEAACGRLGWPELCPVVFALPGGFLVIARRAVACTSADFPVELARRIIESAAVDGRLVGSMVELKYDSWGWLDGRLVAIDYD